jgi:hypothetical protein
MNLKNILSVTTVAMSLVLGVACSSSPKQEDAPMTDAAAQAAPAVTEAQPITPVADNTMAAPAMDQETAPAPAPSEPTKSEMNLGANSSGLGH